MKKKLRRGSGAVLAAAAGLVLAGSVLPASAAISSATLSGVQIQVTSAPGSGVIPQVVLQTPFEGAHGEISTLDSTRHLDESTPGWLLPLNRNLSFDSATLNWQFGPSGLSVTSQTDEVFHYVSGYANELAGVQLSPHTQMQVTGTFHLHVELNPGGPGVLGQEAWAGAAGQSIKLDAQYNPIGSSRDLDGSFAIGFSNPSDQWADVGELNLGVYVGGMALPAVPEPGSLGLMLAGLLGVGALTRAARERASARRPR